MKLQDILFFGGTFNPIHDGHFYISRYVAEQLKLKKVVLIPSCEPPFKNNVLNFKHRYQMLHNSLANTINDDELFCISDMEKYRNGPSYTIDTIRHIRKLFKNKLDKIHWLIGDDNLSQLADWHKIDELLIEATLVVASRYNNLECNNKILNSVKIIKTPQIDISSTEIRDRVKKGLSIKNMVPSEVEKYIYDNRLYKK